VPPRAYASDPYCGREHRASQWSNRGRHRLPQLTAARASEVAENPRAELDPRFAVIPLFAAGPAYDPRNGSPSNAATSFETRAWSRSSASTRRGVAVDTLELGSAPTKPGSALSDREARLCPEYAREPQKTAIADERTLNLHRVPRALAGGRGEWREVAWLRE
jgi:hypothetical protein